MPIRLRDSNVVLGRLRASLDDASSAISGTHTAPPARTGSVAARLDEVSSVISAAFTPAANRTGTIATTLQNFSSSEIGTSAPPQTTFWSNWPIMNCACLQGSSTTTIFDSTRHQEIADKDVVIIQGFYPTLTRLQQRITALDAIHAINPRTKFFPHVMAQETVKTVTAPNNDELEVAYNIVHSATEGHNNWIVHRVNQTGDSGRVEANNDPTNKHECNMAVLVSGLNSLGENYAQAFWRKQNELLSSPLANLLSRLAGVFMDNFNQRPPDMFQNNGALTITDHDFNANGVQDLRTDFTAGANAGGRFWAQGHLEFRTRFYERLVGKVLLPNAARWAVDYLDGNGSPPLPMSGAPFYRQFDLGLREHSNLVLGLTAGASAYSFTGGGSLSSFFRTYNINERMHRLDVNNDKTEKGAVLMHANCVNRTPIAADYQYARLITACCLLAERAAPCVQTSAANPLSLDETLLELGNPVSSRITGTLNENNATFTLRGADQSSGVARFYWAIFTKGMVLVRGDSPGVGAYPSTDAAVTCTLPSPGAGKKWQRINCATYVNPVTGRAMRGQDPGLNNGADATTVSLRPYHAIFLRLVDA